MMYSTTRERRKTINFYIENPYPAPACTAENMGEFQPTDRCSDLFYVCLRNNPTPQFEVYIQHYFSSLFIILGYVFNFIISITFD